MDQPGGVLQKPVLERVLPDRVIGWLALALLAVVIVAVLRGRGDWALPTPAGWAHLLLAMLVLA